ncbi:MAG: hypothetical protein ACQESJ_04965 [Bacteroidota bacterium]
MVNSTKSSRRKFLKKAWVAGVGLIFDPRPFLDNSGELVVTPKSCAH